MSGVLSFSVLFTRVLSIYTGKCKNVNARYRGGKRCIKHSPPLCQVIPGYNMSKTPESNNSPLNLQILLYPKQLQISSFCRLQVMGIV